MTAAGDRLMWWRGLDPDRVDAASVRLESDRLDAFGSSVSADHRVTYRLATGADWATRQLAVDVLGPDGERSLRLTRDDGRWAATWAGQGVEGFALPDLGDALDCDLGLCPLTNTMPVRRHGLIAAAHAAADATVELAMAWVSVPDLAVHADAQRYTAVAPVDHGGALVRFDDGDYRVVIEVDADGLVVSYPGLAYRR